MTDWFLREAKRMLNNSIILGCKAGMHHSKEA